MADADDTTKLCRKCGVVKPLDAFGRENRQDGRCKDGRHTQCKPCKAAARKRRRTERPAEVAAVERAQRAKRADQINEQARLRRERDRDKINARQRERWHANLAHSREVDRQKRARKKAHYAAKRRVASKLRYRSGGYECVYAREHYKADPEKFRARVAAWRLANPDRTAAYKRNYKARRRRADGSHTAADVAEIFLAQRGRCAYCRAKLHRKAVDHVVSLNKGGSNFRNNLQITCIPCNSSKKDQDPIDFARKLGRLL